MQEDNEILILEPPQQLMTGFLDFAKEVHQQSLDKGCKFSEEEKVSKIVATEMSSVDNSDLDSLKSQLEGIEALYNISLTEELENLEKREKEYAAYLDAEAESYIEDKTRDSDSRSEMSEDKIIEEIFNSLIDR